MPITYTLLIRSQNEQWENVENEIIGQAVDELTTELETGASRYTLSDDDLVNATMYFLEIRIRRVLAQVFKNSPSQCIITFSDLIQGKMTIESQKQIEVVPTDRIRYLVEHPSGKGLRYDLDTLDGSLIAENMCSIGMLVGALAMIVFATWC